MLEKLNKLIENSYCPYSKYPTACIVKMKDGTYFEGVNVENSSFKNGMCAEQSAISAAIADGYTKGDFEEVHIYGKKEKFSFPCFLCRQLLIEFIELDKKIFVYKKTGEIKELTLNDLAPYPFELEEE